MTRSFSIWIWISRSIKRRNILQPNVVGLEERERADRLTKFGRICVSSVRVWPTMLERKLPDGVLSMMSGVKDILVEDADCSSRCTCIATSSLLLEVIASRERIAVRVDDRAGGQRDR